MKVSSEIESLKAYVPGKPINETMREYGLKEVYKLASNENPLGPSPKAVAAIMQALTSLHRYPDATFYELRQVMSEYYSVDPENLTFGNGSNELIDLLVRIFCQPGDYILTSEKAFIAYKICAQAAGVKTYEVPMTTEMKFDLGAMLELVNDSSKPTPKLIFIANPNNPTGTYLKHQEVEEFLEALSQRQDLLVVIDEAYCEFVRDKECADGLSLFTKYQNVVLLRTLSKVFGLAGLRVGSLIASPKVIGYVDRVRNPFNVNHLAQVAAIAAVNDKEYLKNSQNLNWDGLDYLCENLDKLGLKFWPSQANFVLFDTQRDVKKCNEALLKRGVIMRPLLGYGLKTHLRLSIGLKKENEKAINALAEVLNEVPITEA